jgi:hypothetical protein
VLTLTPKAYGFDASDATNPDGTRARRMQVSSLLTNAFVAGLIVC